MTKTIVWVDDDTDIIDPVVRPLELAGHKVVRLRSLAAALDAVEQIRQADLLLLDMLLPAGGIDREFGRYPGCDLLRELRGAFEIDTPVVALTVVTDEDVLHQLSELGVQEIIRKPVRPSELKERVERVLSSRE